ncbi:MAG: hypothetical protein ACFFBP_11100 [Promethearchaeota archaeon]
MKVFQKKDGGIVQIIDKETMQDWPIELPLLFVEYIRSNQMSGYGDVKKEVETYLDEIMNDVAIPRLIRVLEGENVEEIIMALQNIEKISKKNAEMANPIKKYLENLKKNKDDRVKELANSIADSFAKADRRKELAKKRKLMQQKEQQFLDGKISTEEYANARKDYLILKE